MARIVISDNKVYVISNEVLDNPIHIPDSIIYALEPTAVTPPMPLPVTVAVMDIAILAAAFLVYWLRVKRSHATATAQPEAFCITLFHREKVTHSSA